MEWKNSDLRDKFHNEQGIKWEKSQGGPDIDYVEWLEDKICKVKNSRLHGVSVSSDDLRGMADKFEEDAKFIKKRNSGLRVDVYIQQSRCFRIVADKLDEINSR